MENQKQQDDTKKQQAQADPAREGRNANDDFNDEQIDDYGIDESQPDAEEELRKRTYIKGGAGPESGDRNRNDDFEDD